MTSPVLPLFTGSASKAMHVVFLCHITHLTRSSFLVWIGVQFEDVGFRHRQFCDVLFFCVDSFVMYLVEGLQVF